MTPPRLILVLSENWTLTSPRDLRSLVRIAVEAEAAGVDAVMLSEHVVLGPASGADGIMGGPAPFAKADRSRFLQALEEAVQAISRASK